MTKYNPLVEPNKDDWLELSEDDRMNAVRWFHECSHNDLDNDALSIHSRVHIIVENQLAMGVEIVSEAITKLIRQGLDRHDAIHAIGAILSENLFDVVRGESTEFSPQQYRRKLEKITAKRWRKGQY
ncbi:hypothetical protein [Marinomonas transparens]|uniref:Uncharacterized protein n=1 Tax=Marinomonas transparens TaxID=2795388 RepID=A0A934MX12_9GAMM|nr:hypothetical protein [Marinomonas transparens]MBJ7538794.1 hypothetical protein [Marinomonas transparens]